VAFLAFGSVLVLVGANQAALARNLSLDLSRTGLLVRRRPRAEAR